MSSRRNNEQMSASEFIAAQIAKSEQTNSNSEGQERSSRWKRHALGITALVGVGVVAVAVGVTGYGINAANSLVPRIESEGKIVDGGTVVIKDVSMDIEPITIATAVSEARDIKVAYEHKLTGLIEIPLGSTTITGSADVETEITIDPSKVVFSYDGEKQQLIISALGTALAADVNLMTAKSSKDDGTGSFATLSRDILLNISDAIDGTFGTDNSKVPILRDIAEEKLTLENGLNDIFEIAAVAGVDSCTPLIPQKIENFEEKIKENILRVTGGEILNPSSPAMTDFNVALLEEMKTPELQQLVADAIVEIPKNFVIGPDQENSALMEDYKNSGFITTTLDPETSVECFVSEQDAESDKSGGNE